MPDPNSSQGSRRDQVTLPPPTHTVRELLTPPPSISESTLMALAMAISAPNAEGAPLPLEARCGLQWRIITERHA